MYQPTKGSRIRVTRYRRDGRVHFIKTGTVLNILTLQETEGVLEFKDDDGRRVYLATNDQLTAIGMTQTIEPAPTT